MTDTDQRDAPEREASAKRPWTVREFVTDRVSELQEGYLADRAWAVSRLARLRQAAGQPIGRDLALLAHTTGGFYRPDARLPETPTEHEHAIYAAITLFAVHQQSKRDRRMHQNGFGVGRAARDLAIRDDGNARNAVRRRFEQLGMARSWESVQIYARSLIQQLRAADIPLDYGRFAADLVALRDPVRGDAVRNRWGREFYRSGPSVPDETSD